VVKEKVDDSYGCRQIRNIRLRKKNSSPMRESICSTSIQHDESLTTVFTRNIRFAQNSPRLFLLQVSFQAIIGRNYSGGIAVDDVTLTNGLCEDESEPQNNRQGINLTSIFNLVESRWPNG